MDQSDLDVFAINYGPDIGETLLGIAKLEALDIAREEGGRIMKAAIDGLDEHVKALMTNYFIREVAPVLEDKTTRRIAREEVASLCGLVLRRLQAYPTNNTASSGLTIEARAAAADLLNGIFGEALRDFSGDTGEPGK